MEQEPAEPPAITGPAAHNDPIPLITPGNHQQSIMASEPSAPTKPYSVVETYNALGTSYETAFANVPAQVRSLQWLISQLPPRSKILDLGSGTGRPTASMLVDGGHQVKGIDISPVMVSAARERVPGAHFEEGDARTYQPGAEEMGSFDAVTSYFSFIAAVSHADITNLPKRVHSWLKPGGYFVSGWVCPPDLKAENLELKWMGKDVVVSVLPREEVVKAIEEAGFEVLEKIEESYLPKAVEAGICKEGEVWDEPQVFVCARKK